MSLLRFALGSASLGLLAVVASGSASCHSPGPPPPPACDSRATGTALQAVAAGEVAVSLDTQDPLLDPVAADLATYLGESWGAPIEVSRAAPDFSRRWTLWLSTSAAAAAKAGVSIEDGYAIERVPAGAGGTIVVYARDATNLAFGAYALLEELGIRFFHPKEELVPRRASPALPVALDVKRAPLVAQRGIQFHTLHPIEYMPTFNEPSADNLADAKRVVDWLVKTGQNYFQWALLSTVDLASFWPHAQAIADYAHARGVRVGAVVQLWAQAALQNNYDLVTDATQWQAQMDAQLAQLMAVPWDVVEIGLGEFRAGDPASIVAWLSHATTQIAALRPGTQVNAQNHVGNYPQLWVPYQGQTVFYYQLPQFADPGLGMSVHSLFFFDLYRDWAMYDHPDFHLQHDFLLRELPSRRVVYFPESAYWVTADISVPLFLPEYVQARWNDVHGLTAEIAAQGLPAMAGHVTFSSGHEWGYWMTDYLTARMLWQPDATVSSLFADYAASYGACAGDVAAALSQLTALQTRYLFDDRLAPYVMAEDSTVDLGRLAGIATIPRRVQFEEVAAMSEADRAAFEGSVVDELGAMAAQVRVIEDGMAARCASVDAELAPWCDELWDGVAADRLRLEHASLLYRAVLAHARGDGAARTLLDQASAATTAVAAVIARREAHYRFDLNRVTDAGPNPTFYPYGYLHQTHTQCYFTRREAQVRSLVDDGTPALLSDLPTCDN